MRGLIRLCGVRVGVLVGTLCAAVLAAGVSTLVLAPIAGATPGCTVTGTVQITDTSSNTSIGFVSNVWNSFGEYVSTTTPSQYLSVSVPVGNAVDVTALNGPNATFPQVGGIQGFASTSANLGAGSFNYAYLGGTTHTAPGATPTSGPNSFTAATGIPETFESSIWSLGGTGSLTPQWVNTDASSPATHLVVITGILVLTGDTTAFGSTFGAFTNAGLTLVPSGPAACAQSVSFTTPAPANSLVGGSYTPTATATSGLPVAISVDSTSTVGACSLNGSTVDFTGPGQCVVDANQPGSSIFVAATQQQQSFSIVDPLVSLLTQVTGVGPGTSLADKVKQIQANVAAGNKAGACGGLVNFIGLVNAQKGKKLTSTQAASFVAQAQYIETTLGC